jgi:PAS domain S-box-containing protein
MPSRLHLWTANLAVAGIYFCAGRLGLTLAYLHESASAVWPASGIALAVVLLWGYRLWPGVFVGAFLVNIASGSLPASIGIAVGNTLEPLVGAWLVNRFANGPRVFERARNILKFVLLAAVLSTAISATFGVTALSLAGLAEWRQYGEIWLTWWLGDLASDLLFAPLVVIWIKQPLPVLDWKRLLEAAALLAFVFLLGPLFFFAAHRAALEYIIMLPLLWAALRFGQHGAVTMAIFIAAIALWATLVGVGPFAAGNTHDSLLQLQVFLSILAIATLVLASAITERLRAEQRLQVQEAVSRILADSPSIREASRRTLEILCQKGGWSTGAIWSLDQAADELECMDFWSMPSKEVPRFEALTRSLKLPRGTGLPGRAYSTGDAAWIPDFSKDNNFPRAPAALAEGLRAGFAFPVKVRKQTLSVIECFTGELRERDEHFLQMLNDIGAQLGQFFERKQVEDALLESEKELADFFDTASQGFHWVSRDGTILKANPAQLKLLGYAENEYVGRNVVDFHAEREPGCDILERLRRGDVLEEYPAQMRCKDGSIKDVLINSSLYWKNGRLIHTRCFMRDVTNLKRAEEARAMLAAIVQSSDDAIISKNLDGVITTWNEGAERIYGYRAVEMIGQSILRIVPPDRHEEEAAILARLRRGERIDQFETVRLARDNLPIDVSLTISPVKNSEGEIIGVSKIARDITERKRAQELLNQARDQLLRANEDLEKRVQERTAELEKAHSTLIKNMEEQKKLEDQLRQVQKMESIGTLAGGIAHDFNNILNIIRGYVTVAMRESAENPQLAESMNIIEQEIDRGAAVVRQLLTIARKTETRLALTDINRIVGNLAELIEQTFPKTIHLLVETDGALPPVLADGNQISQALLNICVNARDAMPRGGKLTLMTEAVEGTKIRTSCPDAKATRYVCIGVTDTGVGMDEGVRSRVFEPFFTTKGFGEGTGLGLAMVYGIVQNHGGFINVESVPGRGTTFRFYLPVLDVDHQSTAGDIVAPAAEPSNREDYRGTVLVVEDEKPMIFLLKKSLLAAGYDVLTAGDGEEAISLYQSQKHAIDVVLLDLGLPKTGGAEVIRMLKAQRHDLRIIVASGYLEPELKSELLRAGVQDYIQKPYRLDDVIQKIGAAIQISGRGCRIAAG